MQTIPFGKSDFRVLGDSNFKRLSEYYSLSFCHKHAIIINMFNCWRNVMNNKLNFFENPTDDNNDSDKIDISLEELELKERNIPAKRFDEQTGAFVYKDDQLREKAEKRKLASNYHDEIQTRLQGLKKHLSRKGLENELGKTGNSSTGEVSEQDKKVAAIQTEHAKSYILRHRNRER